MTLLKNNDDYVTVSYSQYSMWMNCPHHWKLIYIDKIPQQPNNIYTLFGSAMHDVIQTWLDEEYYKDSKKASRIDLSHDLKTQMILHFKESIIEDPSGNKEYPATKDELQEAYEDGCLILDHVVKYAKEFFPTKNCKLIGCEVPLTTIIKGKLQFKAYLDIVIHDEAKNEYHIIDLKTSIRGWHKYHKTNPQKTQQVLLYKKFYSELFNVPVGRIFPKFIILKRKIYENSDYLIKRLSKFEPAHGIVSLNKTTEMWDQFIDECFNDEGERIADNVKATPSEKNCKYCQFRDDEKLCPYSYYVQQNK